MKTYKMKWLFLVLVISLILIFVMTRGQLESSNGLLWYVEYHDMERLGEGTAWYDPEAGKGCLFTNLASYLAFTPQNLCPIARGAEVEIGREAGLGLVGGGNMGDEGVRGRNVNQRHRTTTKPRPGHPRPVTGPVLTGTGDNGVERVAGDGKIVAQALMAGVHQLA